MVPRRRFELLRACAHHPLKMACLPDSTTSAFTINKYVLIYTPETANSIASAPFDVNPYLWLALAVKQFTASVEIDNSLRSGGNFFNLFVAKQNRLEKKERCS